MQIAIWLFAGVVIGAALGAVATWWWSRGRGGGDTIGQLKRENEKFREEVAEHFVETARLINRMTDSYKEVFDHLSQGADRLVDERRLSEKMPRVSDREVRLRHLGAPEASKDAPQASKDKVAATASTASKSRSGGPEGTTAGSGQREAGDPLERKSGTNDRPAGEGPTGPEKPGG